MDELNGILCIDKPDGFTSFDVVAKMRGIARTKKIGHAGTLDPMATGVLPLFFGRATKACDILPRQDKRYLATIQLGITTDTQDITGRILEEKPVTVVPEQVASALKQFEGEIQQIPPMYSAIKIEGKRLYDLARQGIEVERKPRPITIHAIRLVDANPQTHTYQLDVHCSKGTYIRTLAADLGERLGCGAALSGLRRTMAAGFTIEQCITLEQAAQLAQSGSLKDALLPIGNAFDSLPKAWLNEQQTRMFLNGVRMDPARIRCSEPAIEYAVHTKDRLFLGTATIADENFKLQKLFVLEV